MKLISSCMFVLAFGASAHAEEPDATSDAAPAGDRVTLPTGRALLRANLEINLSKDTAFEPVSLAPDLWYGVTDQLTLGLVHSGVGATGLVGGVGDSLCLVDDACDDVYHNVGLDGRYALAEGTFALAANAGLHAGDLDPFQLALKLGIVGRYRPSATSALAIDFAPSVFIGLTEREPEGMTGRANKETLVVPVSLVYDVAAAFAVSGQLGLVLPFDGAGDAYRVPFSIGASYQVSARATVDAAFSLPVLGGGDLYETGVDARTLTLGGGYAF